MAAQNNLIKLELIDPEILRPSSICRSRNFLWITSKSGIYKVDPQDGHLVQLVKKCIAIDICFHTNSGNLFTLVSVSDNQVRKGPEADVALLSFNEDGQQIKEPIPFKREWGRTRKIAISSDGTLFFTTKHEVPEGPTKQRSDIWRWNVETLATSDPSLIVRHDPHNMFALAILEEHSWIVVGDW